MSNEVITCDNQQLFEFVIIATNPEVEPLVSQDPQETLLDWLVPLSEPTRILQPTQVEESSIESILVLEEPEDETTILDWLVPFNEPIRSQPTTQIPIPEIGELFLDESAEAELMDWFLPLSEPTTLPDPAQLPQPFVYDISFEPPEEVIWDWFLPLSEPQQEFYNSGTVLVDHIEMDIQGGLSEPGPSGTDQVPVSIISPDYIFFGKQIQYQIAADPGPWNEFSSPSLTGDGTGAGIVSEISQTHARKQVQYQVQIDPVTWTEEIPEEQPEVIFDWFLPFSEPIRPLTRIYPEQPLIYDTSFEDVEEIIFDWFLPFSEPISSPLPYMVPNQHETLWEFVADEDAQAAILDWLVPFNEPVLLPPTKQPDYIVHDIEDIAPPPDVIWDWYNDLETPYFAPFDINGILTPESSFYWKFDPVQGEWICTVGTGDSAIWVCTIGTDGAVTWNHDLGEGVDGTWSKLDTDC